MNNKQKKRKVDLSALEYHQKSSRSANTDTLLYSIASEVQCQDLIDGSDEEFEDESQEAEEEDVVQIQNSKSLDNLEHDFLEKNRDRLQKQQKQQQQQKIIEASSASTLPVRASADSFQWLPGKSIPKIIENSDASEEESADGDSSESSSEEKEPSVAPASKKLKRSERQNNGFSSSGKSFDQLREVIAELATAVIEDSKSISKLKHLLAFLSPSFYRSSREIPKKQQSDLAGIATVSLLATYKQILPGYRISDAAASENEKVIAKDVLDIKLWERSLLLSYGNYLKRLSAMSNLKASKKSAYKKSDLFSWPGSLSAIAYRCLCELLGFAFDFNYGNELLELIASGLFQSGEFATMGSNAISLLFAEITASSSNAAATAHSLQYRAVLSLLQLLSSAISARNYEIPYPQVLI